ncbi:MAG: C2H2-type zinc finger protein [Bacteroidota bacterium]|nr:C2H2-type zinc finger protein [Bacteroidota bacterium]MDP4229776.1 C2H2-type zinc finger protein [Bacteroidota bacterium]MDP4237011.1 C2H2-type zinc finger protein [Bacteroidota bacterium]
METKEKESPIIETEEFVCDICGEKFNSISKLEDHKLRHSRPGLRLDDEERQMRGDIGAAGLPTSPTV